MEQPKTTPVNPKLHAALIEADAQVKAVNQMTQMFQANAQARLQAAQSAARKAWEEIGRETGIDLRNVSWEPHPTEPAVVPTAVRLSA